VAIDSPVGRVLHENIVAMILYVSRSGADDRQPPAHADTIELALAELDDNAHTARAAAHSDDAPSRWAERGAGEESGTVGASGLGAKLVAEQCTRDPESA
jgi:hypothetical protein